MAHLTDHFIIQLYKLIFEEDPTCMSQGSMEVIAYITDWYASPGGTFLRVFSGEKPPRVLPRYNTDNLVMQQVSYHLATRLSTAFHRKNKAPWPTLPLKIVLYEINNLKVMDTEGKEIVKFAFHTWYFNQYDPLRICKDHCTRIYFPLIGREFHWPEEDPWRNCYNAFRLREYVSLVGTS